MKITPTMLEGLNRMAEKLRRQPEVMAEPNDNTGKALVARGLVKLVTVRHGWKYYVLTDAGRVLLEAQGKAE